MTDLERPSSQEKIGYAVIELKKMFPNKTASERADIVMDTMRYGNQQGREIHSRNGKAQTRN